MLKRSLLPAALALALAMPAAAQQERTSNAIRNAFVRDQTILGLLVYGPAFATMVGEDGVTATAGYLVMAGGTFFAAAELTRRVNITEARQILATRMAWRSAAGALYISTAGDANGKAAAGAALIGGLVGTGAGLAIGDGLTPGEAMATVFGHDLAAITASSVMIAVDPSGFDDRGPSDQTRAIVITAAGWAGYAIGRLYAGNASYNVTAGDVSSLWLGAVIGAAAAGTAIAGSDPAAQTVALTLLGGGLAGTYLADRFLVKRYDHTRPEGRLLALGGLAGGLMGVGVGVLVAGEAERDGPITVGFGAAGAALGVVLTERFMQPRRDEGRQFGLGRLTIDPVGLAAAATGARGHHSLVRFTF